MNDFTCAKCGNCCRVSGYVRLRGGEAERIADFLHIPLTDFTRLYTRLMDDRTGLSLVENGDLSCIFLKGDSSCLINRVKPAQCAGFPFKWNFENWERICEGEMDETVR